MKASAGHSKVNIAGLLWRALLVLAMLLGVGLWTATLIARHAAAANAPVAQIRLASAMAGLFAGGAAALLTILALAFMGRK